MWEEWKQLSAGEKWKLVHMAVLDALVMGGLMLAVVCMVKWLRT